MSPAQLVELMNEYLTVCTDIIQEEGGTLDKYIGDAVVAIFGAPVPLPDHAFRACLATQRVQWAMKALGEKWRGEGEKWPAMVQGMRSRLGLNTGPAIIGNMGSRTRFSYTMMGDHVNLAARMESGAKALGVYTMVTEATKLACEKYGGDRMVFRFLDRIIVKGRGQPVEVFEIVGLRENVLPVTFQCLALYAQALELYFREDWDGAIQIFEQSLLLEPNQVNQELGIENNPSSIFIQRCRRMKFMEKHSTDSKWDGVYTLKDK
jgi:adenylate cyclase